MEIKKIARKIFIFPIILYEDSIIQYLDYREFFEKHNITYTFKLMTAKSMVTIDKLEVSNVVQNELYFGE